MLTKTRNHKAAESAARYWGKSLADKDWYSIKAQSGGEAEILIYDVIGWPFISAEAFVRDLSQITAENITVRINSPGGDVFDGTAIYNALRAHKAKIVTRIEGLAASMASIVALAGDEVQIAKNAFFMIHNPWVVAAGDHEDMSKTSEILSKLTDSMARIYADTSNLGIKAVREAMKNETWYTGKEAHDAGFADTVLDSSGEPIKAKFDLSLFAKAPEEILAGKEGRELTEREVERALRDAGASRSFAKALVGERFGALRDAELKAEIETVIAKIKS